MVWRDLAASQASAKREPAHLSRKRKARATNACSKRGRREADGVRLAQGRPQRSLLREDAQATPGAV